MTSRSIPPRWSRRAVLASAVLSLVPSVPRAAGPATRIASLGGAVTEILYRLGAAERVVAVDTTSLFPAQALREKPNVGYLRALSAEGLLSLGPDLVIAAEGAGPPEVLALVREAGIPVSMIKEPPTSEGVLDKILTVGRLAGVTPAAESLAAEVGTRFAELARLRARLDRRARALVILSVANGRIMVGGRDSTADGILALAGIDNAVTGFEGFKPITDEAILAAAPHVVVMMQNGADAPKPDTVFASGTALGQTPAAARRALVAMDGLALLGFGPRTPDAARDLMRAIYPDLARD